MLRMFPARYRLFISTLALIIMLSACNLGTDVNSPAVELTTGPTEEIDLRQRCEDTVQEAREIAEDTCPNGLRNQVCHASPSVEVTSDEVINFAEVGSVVDIASITGLRTSPLDISAGTWGIAEMWSQVNGLVDTLPGQNVQFLIFGDTEITNTDATMNVFTISNTLPRNCTEIIATGVLLQSPANESNPISMQINGAEIRFGSTLYLNATRDNVLRVALLEGTASVTAADVTKRLVPGTEVRMVLGGEDGLTVVSAPTDPQPYDLDAIQDSPLELLDRPFELPEPTTIDDDAVAAAVTTEAPQGCTLTTEDGFNLVNVRSGPGTEYTVEGQITSDDTLTVVGRNTSSTGSIWYVVNRNGQFLWVAASVTNIRGNCDNLQLVNVPPTPTPTPTNTPTPTPTYASDGVAVITEEAYTPSCIDPFASPAWGTDTIDNYIGERTYRLSSGVGVNLTCVTSAYAFGYSDVAPDLIIDYGAPGILDTLTFSFSSRSDGVMLIRTPDGSYFFNDDSEGLNPGITFDRAQPGNYTVWIGRYAPASAGSTPTASFGIAGTQSFTTAPSGSISGTLTVSYESYSP